MQMPLKRTVTNEMIHMMKCKDVIYQSRANNMGYIFHSEQITWDFSHAGQITWDISHSMN